MITATRYHDISCGHRVCGHESKCAHLHGHNYRVTFECAGETESLDELGRVLDFSVIKEKLCMWLGNEWDHHFLVWKEDPLAPHLKALDPTVVELDFNPTAENIAHHLATVVAPECLRGSGVRVIRCTVEETRKCSAEWRLFNGFASLR